MRFRTLVPVLAVVLGVALGACKKGEEGAEEMAPAETTQMAPAPEMPAETMPADTMAMPGDTM